METITATELARNLSHILSRVQYKGESFRVERNGEAVAVLQPGPSTKKPLTVEEFRHKFGNVRVPEGFADAIEDARKALGPLPEPPWDSS
jgi:antitoxin (DNA-binding transcriptional repressor) of toxin-antitoxin stability system